MICSRRVALRAPEIADEAPARAGALRASASPACRRAGYRHRLRPLGGRRPYPALPGLIAAGKPAASASAASRPALFHDNGNGALGVDPAQARSLDQTRCDAFPDRFALAGCNNLAVPLEAAELDDRVGTVGFAVDCANPALPHAGGGPLGPDPAEVLRHFDRACDLGVPVACWDAVLMLGSGEGVPVDPTGGARSKLGPRPAWRLP